MSSFTREPESEGQRPKRREKAPPPRRPAVPPAAPAPAPVLRPARVDSRLAPLLDPTSPIAEQYRALRTNLLALRAQGRAMKTLVVSSARRGDGKTITSINAASIFAEDRSARVILVDADLRAGGVSGLLSLGPDSGPGLTGYLRDGEPLESVVVGTRSKNLDVIPSGPALDNPTELLASARMGELIEALAESYDFAFFDTPPVLAVTDAAILGTRVDGVVFVVKLNDSEKDAVDRSLEALKSAGASVIGAVVTNFRDAEAAYSRQRK